MTEVSENDVAAAMGSLHDLVLDGIRVDWDRALVFIDLADHDESQLSVVAYGLTDLTLARDLPWGPSRTVNDLAFERLDGTRLRMRLGMQSGDVIEIVGTRFERQGDRSVLGDPAVIALGLPRYPAMRVGLRDGLRLLANLGGGPGTDPASCEGWQVRDGINWLDDNAPKSAAKSIGWVLYDAEEARLVDLVHAAVDVVLVEVQRETGTDRDWFETAGWPAVNEAASAALKHLEATDAERAA